MAKEKNESTRNKKGTGTAKALPSQLFGKENISPRDESKLFSATAASIREHWETHDEDLPVFDDDPTPLPSQSILGHRPSESDYAATLVFLLADEVGYDDAYFQVVNDRLAVAVALHLGVEPNEIAAMVERNHRTIAAAVRPEEGNVLVWRYAEWGSKEDWERGGDWHTAMYNTNRADIVSTEGFGGYIRFQEIAVPIGSFEHTSAENNARIGRRP